MTAQQSSGVTSRHERLDGEGAFLRAQVGRVVVVVASLVYECPTQLFERVGVRPVEPTGFTESTGPAVPNCASLPAGLWKILTSDADQARYGECDERSSRGLA